MGLGKLAKMIKSKKRAEPVTTSDKFIKLIDKYNTAKPEDIGKEPRPTRLAFRPSSMHKCARESYYFLTGEEKTRVEKARSRRILAVGNELHEWIQDEVITNMSKYEQFPIRLLTCEEMPNYGEEGIEYITAHGSSPIEIKFLDNRWSKDFPISGMVDGAMEFDSQDMLFEFKTINTKDFGMLIEPKKDHKIQGAVYSKSTGIPRVMFLYLDKNTQDLKAYLVEYTEEQLDWVTERIEYIERFLEKEEVPPKEASMGCMWCEYKALCVAEEEGEEVVTS